VAARTGDCVREWVTVVCAPSMVMCGGELARGNEGDTGRLATWISYLSW
jgi:hypothetical protein